MTIYIIDSWDDEDLIIKANDKVVFKKTYN